MVIVFPCYKMVAILEFTVRVADVVAHA